MSYVDYDYYKSDAGFTGVALDERQFMQYRKRAEEFIDAVTFKRLHAYTPERIPECVKDAVCELAEWLNNYDETGGQVKQSETVGSYSVTYSKPRTVRKEDDMLRIVRMHLSGSDLLYRGV